MNLRQRRITSLIALLLIFSTTQVYIAVTIAGPQPTITGGSEVALPAPQQQATGSLMTQGNKAITVNGASAVSGATILSGASIESPDGVGGTINLASLGSLQFGPNTKLSLEFQNGSVKVMLLQGCVTLRTKKGTSGEIDNPQGVIGKSGADKDGTIRTCTPGAAPIAAAAAGGGGLFGLGTAATIGIIAGGITAVAVPVIVHGRNPSPGTP
jgi:hypothetical protein